MKKDLHPQEYRLMVVQDTSDGSTFLTRCTAKTDETIVWDDGQTYPLLKIHISSATHPFFTGQEKLVDVEGRVDRFKARQKHADEHRRAMLARTEAKHPAKKKPAAQPPAAASPSKKDAIIGQQPASKVPSSHPSKKKTAPIK